MQISNVPLVVIRIYHVSSEGNKPYKILLLFHSINYSIAEKLPICLLVIYSSLTCLIVCSFQLDTTILLIHLILLLTVEEEEKEEEKKRKKENNKIEEEKKRNK